MRVVDRAVFERIRGRLARLYGEAQLPRLLQRLELLVGRYGVGSHCLQPDAQRERCRGWDQRDAVLIAYGDMVRSDADAPLAALRSFLDERVGDAVSALHLLPFFPSSSDDGFAVIDYRTVDPALGTWDDIDALSEDYRLATDLVINHVSGQSHWFRAYCNGMAPERHYFIEVDPGTDLSAVTRPRTSPLLRAVQTPYGERHLWATFSHDQLDVDFSNPDVLFEYLDILLLYVHHGAQIIRLDAIAYLWKRIGTPCIHLPETHELVKLLRDLLEMLAPGVLLLSETNVPHAENISYFGAGDEAHMVYQFSLPPLLLHALHTGDAGCLSAWAANLAPPPPGCTFFNFTASHDGIGVRPLEGLVPEAELAALVAAMEQRGGLVSRRSNPDGSATPYELNITWFDAVGVPGDRDASIRRFLCSQTIALSLKGIPGIYFNSLLGADNDLAAVEQTGRARSINRRKWTAAELDRMLGETSGHQAALVLPEYLRRLHVRAAQPAFHPDAAQQVLELPKGLFGVRRDDPHTGQRLWMLANLTGRKVGCALSRLDRHWQRAHWRELISAWDAPGAALATRLELAPHQVVWLTQTAPAPVADSPPEPGD
ncbi:sugar phosphorylase [uncultured Thiohalocapsa sp.]|mgnify:CR=1 FL=1|uniref:sugar phosphorylase n=1 Tax=uncultured Thiohalocapsa sp. TaxID=768990 RepID=UPI0025F8F27B|nr:sugar phosphorylase [uncultured Thiohalocapsa sp.]